MSDQTAAPILQTTLRCPVCGHGLPTKRPQHGRPTEIGAISANGTGFASSNNPSCRPWFVTGGAECGIAPPPARI